MDEYCKDLEVQVGDVDELMQPARIVRMWRERGTIIRGSGGKSIFFQIVQTPHLGILLCSNWYQNDILKDLLKQIDHNLPIGYVKY
jgi:hypothetical protein